MVALAQPRVAEPIAEDLAPDEDGFAERIQGRRLLVVSNRGPVWAQLGDDQVELRPGPGGVGTALASLANLVPVTWIATATEPCDQPPPAASAPPAPGAPRFHPVKVPKRTFEWFYYRFANPVLWLLQHNLWTELRRPKLSEFIERAWVRGYVPVNETFARAIADEARGTLSPIIQVHDYHFYLVPELVRRLVPTARIEHFTHIPWPEPNAWLGLSSPVCSELYRGLLGADLLGFQTPESAAHFLDGCQRFLAGASVDARRGIVWYHGASTLVRVYPVCADARALRQSTRSTEFAAYKQRLQSTAGLATIVRVDRMDPSKNILLGFQAYERLLARRPDLIGHVRFLAFLVPSRSRIPEYRRYARKVWQAVEQVNTRFGTSDWKPVEVYYQDNRTQALAGRAIADVLLVNPWADGMNLVAKEGIIVGERDPVLVLSRTCGAHVQLGSNGSLSVTPGDVAQTADALEQALEMSPTERSSRARRLRGALDGEDTHSWLDQQLGDLLGSLPPTPRSDE